MLLAALLTNRIGYQRLGHDANEDKREIQWVVRHLAATSLCVEVPTHHRSSRCWPMRGRDAETGRGLMLVADLVHYLGLLQKDTGKVSTFMLAAEPDLGRSNDYNRAGRTGRLVASITPMRSHQGAPKVVSSRSVTPVRRRCGLPRGR